MPDNQFRELVAGNMAQWVKVLATQPDHISSFPGTDLVRGEKQLPHILLLLVCHGACAGAHTCKKNMEIFKV